MEYRDFGTEVKVGEAGQRRFAARHPGRLQDISGTYRGDFVIRTTGDKVELKTDTQGHETGNLFVELDMTSEGSGLRRSGVYQAIEHGCKYIVYQTEDEKEFWFDPVKLKDLSEEYRRTHGELYRQVQNIDHRTGERYWSGGMKMPKTVLESIRILSPLEV